MSEQVPAGKSKKELKAEIKAIKVRAAEEIQQLKEQAMQLAILDIQKKFGKNAVLKAMDFEEGATARERNRQIGGHRA